MAGDEPRVQKAFCSYLTEQGWKDITTSVHDVDVRATRDGKTLYAEVKGKTKYPDVDADIMFGQLLRRMPQAHDPDVQYAAVVPDSALSMARRVSQRVRELLRIDLYTVTDDGKVELQAG